MTDPNTPAAAALEALRPAIERLIAEHVPAGAGFAFVAGFGIVTDGGDEWTVDAVAASQADTEPLGERRPPAGEVLIGLATHVLERAGAAVGADVRIFNTGDAADN